MLCPLVKGTERVREYKNPEGTQSVDPEIKMDLSTSATIIIKHLL